jgi:hypothetical protein
MATPSDDYADSTDLDCAIASEFHQAQIKYQLFWQALPEPLQIHLAACDWWIGGQGHDLELVIHCTHPKVRVQVFQALLTLATRLDQLFGAAKVRIEGGGCFPFSTHTEQVIRYYRFWHPDHPDLPTV